MTNRTFTQIEGEAVSLPGVAASPVPAASGSNIIPFPHLIAAASDGWGAEEADDTWMPIGLLAVRMIGNFTRPNILVWSQEPSCFGEEE